MKEELKRQVIAKLKEYSKSEITLGNSANSLIVFIDEYKPMLDQLKELDIESWKVINDGFIRTSLAQLLENLQKLLKNKNMWKFLTTQIQNEPHGTILNSFQVALERLQQFEMSEDLLNDYNDQLYLFNSIKKTLLENEKESNSGCYIATMAYGNYDHPQVMILRQFRDEVLDKSVFGKWFIKTYYYYSPKLVEILKNQRTVNSIIRKALNQFIKLIK